MTARPCRSALPFKPLPRSPLRLVHARPSPFQHRLHGLHHLNGMHDPRRLHRVHRLYALLELVLFDRAVRPFIWTARGAKIERFMKIETSVLAVAMLGEKFTGSMRLVGHLRHCLEPVMPQLRKHHGKADAGFGNVGLGRMLLRVIEKHETPPLRNPPRDAPAPTVLLQTIAPPTLHNS